MQAWSHCFVSPNLQQSDQEKHTKSGCSSFEAAVVLELTTGKVFYSSLYLSGSTLFWWVFRWGASAGGVCSAPTQPVVSHWRCYVGVPPTQITEELSLQALCPTEGRNPSNSLPGCSNTNTWADFIKISQPTELDEGFLLLTFVYDMWDLHDDLHLCAWLRPSGLLASWE